MSEQRESIESAYRPETERPKRQERAYRILDAAAELIQRWGYKKTTIDDIARLAGVAKGTIYLHWKTREDLFMALILRESMQTILAVQTRIDNDPEGVLVSNLVKHSISIIMTRPLAKALFIGDVEVLGELLRSDQQEMTLISQERLMMGRAFMEMLREKGLLRTDHSVTEQMQIYTAIVMGFMVANQYLPEKLQLSPEKTVQSLAETLRLVLEPAAPVSPHALQEARVVWNQIVQQSIALFQEQLQKEME